MKITVAGELVITEPTNAVRQWVKDALIIDDPDATVTKKLYARDESEYQVSLYSEDGDTLILPYGCLTQIRRIEPHAEIVQDFPKAKEVSFKAKIPLYDYQKTAMKKLLDAGCGILEAPSGSGKTQIGLALAASIRRKTLWITWSQDGVHKVRYRALQYMDRSKVGMIDGKVCTIGECITFTTVQRLEGLDIDAHRDTWDTVIVDDCNRVCGTTWNVNRLYTVLGKIRARHKYGLSTPIENENGIMRYAYALLGNPIYKIIPQEKGGDAVKIVIAPIATGMTIDEDKLKDAENRLSHRKMLRRLADFAERDEVILRYVAANAGHTMLIVSYDSEHLRRLYAGLAPRLQKQAIVFSGDMVSKSQTEEREKVLSQMRSGKKKILFARTDFCKEEMDIPCLDRIFLTMPMRRKTAVLQTISRIAKPYGGKTEAMVFDFVDENAYALEAYRKRCIYYRKTQCTFRVVNL